MTPFQHFVHDHKTLRGAVGFEFILDLAIAVDETFDYFSATTITKGKEMSTPVTPTEVPAPTATQSAQSLISDGEVWLNKVDAEIESAGGRELSLVKTKIEEALLWLKQHLLKL